MRALLPRDRDEEFRAATQLELLFDLVFVIAIAAAAHGLAHAIVAGHWQEGLIKFLLVFWCVWWPWNLFTWFASSFDNDDVGYRIVVMVLMVGALFIAASTSGFFEGEDLRYMFAGYVVMRLAFAFLWVRVARAKPCYRGTALIYAGGQVLMQFYWALVVFVVPREGHLFTGLFLLGVVIEMVIPVLGERAGNTQWHRHHIVERFGLLNIIVLGEVLLASSEALRSAMETGFWGNFLLLSLCGVLIAFCLWWLYFSAEGELDVARLDRVFLWAYGHFLVFAGGAAVGAGLVVATDALHEEGHITRLAGISVSVPVAIYLFGLWLVRDQFMLKDRNCWVLLMFVPFVLLAGWTSRPLTWLSVLLVACLFLRLRGHLPDVD
ncbi:low temperature requirement protein A [Biformimicrobium ophioploci]|uniref:Low temperature requirement protein A n=1 Tax=Biformimicrobium ophioploci TaxID=3036711 RepID=A0ABQ6LZK9_9GAMM|nr:low temperature requirement protein A [Microbulbifer sp. NKW57]